MTRISTKRLEQITAILADKKEVTAAQLAAELGLPIQSASNYLAAAHEAKIARIIRWEGSTCSCPVWAIGSEPHDEKRARVRTSLLEYISRTPASALKISQATGANKNTVLRWLFDLHSSGEIHILRYAHDTAHTRCTRPAIYAAGPGEDAPNPYAPAAPEPRRVKPRPGAGPHLLTLAGQLGLLP